MMALATECLALGALTDCEIFTMPVGEINELADLMITLIDSEIPSLINRVLTIGERWIWRSQLQTPLGDLFVVRAERPSWI